MHVDELVREGQFMITDFVPTTEKSNRKFLLLTTGRNLVQYNGAKTRRTHNNE